MANIKVKDIKAIVQFDCIGTPTHYRISEVDDFSDTSWIAFTTSNLTVEYALSEIKIYTLFMQVKSAVMESNIKSMIIERLDTYVTLNLKVVILNDNKNTNQDSIPITLQYDGIPIKYKLVINPVLENNVVNWDNYLWAEYDLFPTEITLTAPIPKENMVYVLLQDDRGVLSETFNTIQYYEPVAPTLINATYESTITNGITVVTPEYSGIALEYSCEFATAPLVWKSFDTSFNLNLSVAGLNNYKLFLRNQYGSSDSFEINVTYNPPAFDINTMLINNNEIDTESNKFNITFTTVGIETVKYYRMGLTEAEVNAAEWLNYSNQPLVYTLLDTSISATVTVYLQLSSNIDNVSTIHSNSINFINPNSVLVQLINASDVADKLTYNNKYYTFSRSGYASVFDVYNYLTGNKITDWRIMNDAETIEEFGGAGQDLGFGYSGNVYAVDHPYYTYGMWYGDQSKPRFYYGLYIPNGTYKVSFLISKSDDIGLINGKNRHLYINGTEITLPAISIKDNTTFVNLGTHTISDGKLKFIFESLGGDSFGFNCIKIEKIG